VKRPVPHRAAAAALPLFLTGCGYIGDTRPPSLKLPVPVTDLAAIEHGGKIIVQFTAPTRTTEDLPLPGDPELVVAISGKTYPVHTKGTPIRAEIDATPFYGQDVTVFVKALNDRQLDAGPSNTVALHVIPAIAPPASLKAAAVAEGVLVSWSSPERSFVVYRQGPGDKAMVKLDTTVASPYLDRNTEYGKEYRYSVQALAGTSVESEIAEMSSPLVPIDTFPPVAPQGLATVVGTKSVELVWERSPESDFAGYRVYRDSGSGQFERIGESRNTPGFSDNTIQPGKKYRYAVTAYDKAGNESTLSEIADAVIP